jgi:hypothetical protein
MKTQTCGFHIYVGDPVAVEWFSRLQLRASWSGQLMAQQDFKKNRFNGSQKDFENNDPPYDGKIIWLKGRVLMGGDYVHGVKNVNGKYEYEVRYDEGPKDRKWMEKNDKKYLKRLLREGKLKEAELDVWYLREMDQVQEIDIGKWWSQKLAMPNIGDILARSEQDYKQFIDREAESKAKQQRLLKEKQEQGVKDRAIKAKAKVAKQTATTKQQISTSTMLDQRSVEELPAVKPLPKSPASKLQPTPPLNKSLPPEVVSDEKKIIEQAATKAIYAAASVGEEIEALHSSDGSSDAIEKITEAQNRLEEQTFGTTESDRESITPEENMTLNYVADANKVDSDIGQEQEGGEKSLTNEQRTVVTDNEREMEGIVNETPINKDANQTQTQPSSEVLETDVYFQLSEECEKTKEQLIKKDQSSNQFDEASMMEQLSEKLSERIKQHIEQIDCITKEEQRRVDQILSNKLNELKICYDKENTPLNQQIDALRERVKRLEEHQPESTELTEVKVKLKTLCGQQEALTIEYNERQELLANQRYIYQYAELNAFYRSIQLQLTNAFLVCKVLSTGLIAREDNKGDIAIKSIELAGQFVPLPGAQAIASIISKSAQHFYDKHQKKRAERVADLTMTISEMEILTESMARTLTYRYEEQLRHIEKRESKILGECAVARILGYIKSGKTNNNEDLCYELVRAVALRKCHGVNIPFIDKSIRTETEGDKWTDAGIFQKPGIKTENNQHFSDDPKIPERKKLTRPEKYGYRLGTEEEARELGLILTTRRVDSKVQDRPILQLSSAASRQIQQVTNAAKLSEEKVELLQRQHQQQIESLQRQQCSLQKQLQEERAAREQSDLKVQEMEKMLKILMSQMSSSQPHQAPSSLTFFNSGNFVNKAASQNEQHEENRNLQPST